MLCILLKQMAIWKQLLISQDNLNDKEIRDYLHSDLTNWNLQMLYVQKFLVIHLPSQPSFTFSTICLWKLRPLIIVITTEINLSLFSTSVSASDNNFIVVYLRKLYNYNTNTNTFSFPTLSSLHMHCLQKKLWNRSLPLH